MGDGIASGWSLDPLPTGVCRSEVAQQPRVKDRIQVMRALAGNRAVPVQAVELGGNTAGFDFVILQNLQKLRRAAIGEAPGCVSSDARNRGWLACSLGLYDSRQ